MKKENQQALDNAFRSIMQKKRKKSVPPMTIYSVGALSEDDFTPGKVYFEESHQGIVILPILRRVKKSEKK